MAVLGDGNVCEVRGRERGGAGGRPGFRKGLGGAAPQHSSPDLSAEGGGPPRTRARSSVYTETSRFTARVDVL